MKQFLVLLCSVLFIFVIISESKFYDYDAVANDIVNEILGEAKNKLDAQGEQMRNEIVDEMIREDNGNGPVVETPVNDVQADAPKCRSWKAKKCHRSCWMKWFRRKCKTTCHIVDKKECCQEWFVYKCHKKCWFKWFRRKCEKKCGVENRKKCWNA